MNDYGKAYLEYKEKQKRKVNQDHTFHEAERLAEQYDESTLRLAAIMVGIVERNKVQKARIIK